MLSHQSDPPPLDTVLSTIRARIQREGDRPHATADELLDLLDQLAAFPLGRFMMTHHGWDGPFTHYVAVYHPRVGRQSGVDPQGRPLTPLERRVLDLPACRATQERFVHFHDVLQGLVREGVRMASLPCGLMDDLLDLDFSAVARFELVGIDLDPVSLELAQAEAIARGLAPHASSRREDAWDPAADGFDVVCSNGLNIYEADDARVVALYRGFHDRLKPGGTLVTSWLVPPAEVYTRHLDPEDLRLQRMVFGDLLAVHWAHYRTAAQTRDQLAQAGLDVVEIRPDSVGLFPTVVARRRNA